MLFRLRLSYVLYYIFQVLDFGKKNSNFLFLLVYSREHITESILKISILSQSQSIPRAAKLNYWCVCIQSGIRARELCHCAVRAVGLLA